MSDLLAYLPVVETFDLGSAKGLQRFLRRLGPERVEDDASQFLSGLATLASALNTVGIVTEALSRRQQVLKDTYRRRLLAHYRNTERTETQLQVIRQRAAAELAEYNSVALIATSRIDSAKKAAGELGLQGDKLPKALQVPPTLLELDKLVDELRTEVQQTVSLERHAQETERLVTNLRQTRASEADAQFNGSGRSVSPAPSATAVQA